MLYSTCSTLPMPPGYPTGCPGSRVAATCSNNSSRLGIRNQDGNKQTGMFLLGDVIYLGSHAGDVCVCTTFLLELLLSNKLFTCSLVTGTRYAQAEELALGLEMAD